MIRQNELVTFLTALSRAVADELRPDLKTDYSKVIADSIVEVLERLIAQAGAGEQIAADRLADWQALESGLGGLGPGHAAGRQEARSPGSFRESLEHSIAAVQERLGDRDIFSALISGLRETGSSQDRWLRRSAASIHSFMEAAEDSYKPRSSAPVEAKAGDNPEFVRLALNRYLEKAYPQLPKEPIDAVSFRPGGYVKLTAILSLKPNALFPKRVVLRKDKAMSITGTSVVDEFPIVERISRLGLPVPEPLFLEPDSAILDGAFMVMTEIADAAPAGTYFAKERALVPRTTGPDFGREVATVMARLHSLTEASPGTHKVPSMEADARAVQALHETWLKTPKPPFSVSTDLSFAWLLAHPLPPNRPQCLVHGDFGMHNILVRDGHLAALLDWELAHEGDPAEDLAQCRMLLLEDTMPWEEFVQAYLAAGGNPRAFDQNAVAYYCVWTFLKHGVMNYQFRHYFVSGARTDSVAASLAFHSCDRVTQYQARALKLAISAQA